MCGAKPKQKCTLSTGHPSLKTHRDRSLAAEKAGPPENMSHATMRIVKAATSRGFRSLFHHT
jgi:hypothetical protein